MSKIMSKIKNLHRVSRNTRGWTKHLFVLYLSGFNNYKTKLYE